MDRRFGLQKGYWLISGLALSVNSILFCPTAMSNPFPKSSPLPELNLLCLFLPGIHGQPPLPAEFLPAVKLHGVKGLVIRNSSMLDGIKAQ
ncbi:MAG: hypothetical protein JWR19_2117 [Pedosphaera sp.]|nr:hypothetical protein [Pedosphaera sp.]